MGENEIKGGLEMRTVVAEKAIGEEGDDCIDYEAIRKIKGLKHLKIPGGIYKIRRIWRCCLGLV